MIETVNDDPRNIRLVSTMGGDVSSFWCVGMCGVTSIKPYFEPGQMAMVPWLAIYKDDVILQRVSIASVESIEY